MAKNNSISKQTLINIVFFVLILYLLFGSGLNIRGRAVNDMHTTFGHEWSQNGPYEIMMVMDNGNVRIGDNNEMGNARLAVIGGPVGIGTIDVADSDVRFEVVGGAIKATDGLIIEARTDDPTSPQDGRIWLRTDL